MTEENNGRLDRIEKNIEALTVQIAALVGVQANSQIKLDHVIRLVGSIADKTFEHERKLDGIKDALK
jgi:hypothetical protein